MRLIDRIPADNRTLRRAGIALGVALAVVVGALIVNALRADRALDDAVSWERHTLEVIIETERLQSDLRAAESRQRGFLLTNSPVFLADYREQSRNVSLRLAALSAATRDNPRQQANIAALNRVVAERLAAMDRLLAIARTIDAVSPREVLEGRDVMGSFRDAIGRVRDEERRLLVERRAEAERSDRWAKQANYALALAGAGLLGLVVLLALAVLAAIGRARTTTTRAAVEAGLRGELEARVTERTRDLRAANLKLIEEARAREAAEQSVRQMQKMESVGALTGGIAHDFNNMLAIVIGSLDMARRKLETDPARALAYIGNAEEGAQRAAQLTARLLAFSRQQPLSPEPIDANKFVAGMSELLRRTIPETVRIETVLAGGLWRARVDPGQLENAIVNLAVNARDAMPEGGKLTIETANGHLDDAYAAGHAEVEAGQYVVICVTDTGTGMSGEVAERAFDPFYTTKGVGKGSGLGLSQVYGFTKQSGGHIKIYSEIGVGTTVKLYMPRFVGEDAPEPAAMSDGPMPTGRAEEIILVVEDEDRVRHLSIDTLRELGYTVVQASDGAEALEQLGVQPRIDLLFTDIVMPGINGRQLADRARAIRPELKVLYTTGYTKNAIVHNGVVDAGVAFLAKPYSIDQLARRVRAVLGGGGGR